MNLNLARPVPSTHRKYHQPPPNGLSVLALFGREKCLSASTQSGISAQAAWPRERAIAVARAVLTVCASYGFRTIS